jgi:hypothetical protein
VAVVAPFLISRQSVWRTVRVLAAGAVMCVVTWPVRDLFFLVPAAIGAVVYTIAVYAFRVIDDYERQMLASMLARAINRGKPRARSGN